MSFIQRTPKIDFVAGSSRPDVEGWPEVRQRVVWEAEIRNYSDRDLRGVRFRWLLDAAEVASGEVDVPAWDLARVQYPWTWSFERHTLSAEIDPGDLLPGDQATNNRRTVATDALSVGLYIERGAHDWFRENLLQTGLESVALEDWAQAQIEYANLMFGEAVYEETPFGVIDRWRLDAVHVVPDGTLPTRQNMPSTQLDTDHSVDLIWHFTTEGTVGSGESFSPILHSNPDRHELALNLSWIHEMLHVRGLVDVFVANVMPVARDSIALSEAGEPVAGSPFMPSLGPSVWNGHSGFVVYRTPEEGLMVDAGNGTLDRYSAVTLNRMEGERPRSDNRFGHAGVGRLARADLPQDNRVLLRD